MSDPSDTSDLSWQEHARCKSVPTELFFAHKCVERCRNGGCQRSRRQRDYEVIQEAREVCFTCPVIEHCRYWSVMTVLEDGIAGGMTAAERVKMRVAIRTKSTIPRNRRAM